MEPKWKYIITALFQNMTMGIYLVWVGILLNLAEKQKNTEMYGAQFFNEMLNVSLLRILIGALIIYLLFSFSSYSFLFFIHLQRFL